MRFHLFSLNPENTAYFLFNLFDGMTETEVQAKEEMLREYLSQLNSMVCVYSLSLLNIITCSVHEDKRVLFCLHLVFSEHHHSCEYLQRNQEHPKLLPRARANKGTASNR